MVVNSGFAPARSEPESAVRDQFMNRVRVILRESDIMIQQEIFDTGLMCHRYAATAYQLTTAPFRECLVSLLVTGTYITSIYNREARCQCPLNSYS